MNTLIIATTTLQLQVDRQRTRRGLPAATVVGCCYLAMALTGAQQPWQAEAFVSRGGFGASPPSPPVRSWGPTRTAKAVPLKGPLRVASTPVAVSMSSTDTEAGPMTGGEGGDSESADRSTAAVCEDATGGYTICWKQERKGLGSRHWSFVIAVL